MTLSTSFAGKTATVEVLEPSPMCAVVVNKSWLFSVIPYVLLATPESAWTAIKTALLTSETTDSSAGQLNMGEEEAIPGNSVMGLILTECIVGVKRIKEKEIVSKMALLFILSANLDTITLDAVSADHQFQTAKLWD